MIKCARACVCVCVFARTIIREIYAPARGTRRFFAGYFGIRECRKRISPRARKLYTCVGVFEDTYSRRCDSWIYVEDVCK